MLFVILDNTLIMSIGRPLPDGYINTFWLTVQAVLILALPFIFAVSENSKIDGLIGELSYPIYICYFLLLGFALPPSDLPLRGFAFLAEVLVCSVVLMVVTGPIDRWRERAVANRVRPANVDSPIVALSSLIQSEKNAPSPAIIVAGY